MKRKVVCILLCFMILMSVVLPAQANDMHTTRVEVSEDVYIEMTAAPILRQGRQINQDYTFTISQYENGFLVQTVSGETKGDRLLVVDYVNGRKSNSETILILDRINKLSLPNAEMDADKVTSSSLIKGEQELMGTIIYNPGLYSGEVKRIQVFNEIVNRTYEIIELNAFAADTLAIFVGVIVSTVFYFLTPAVAILAANDLAVTIISGMGGSVLGGAIGKNIKEPVNTTTTYHEVFGYDYAANRYSTAQTGTIRRVITMGSSSYNSSFASGTTPRDWGTNSLAISLWNLLFDPHDFNGVRSWS